MTFFEKLNEVLGQQSKTTFSTSEIKKLMFDAYQIEDESVIPSDYCYNRTNHGRKFDTETRILEYLGRGEYKFLGKSYKYNGPVYHREKDSTQEKKVGEWLNGIYQPSVQTEGLGTDNIVELTAMGSEPKKEIRPSLNQILYGAAGTGKTYKTINKALEIIAPQFLAENKADRKALKARFDLLMDEKRIRFVTFHQSFSYEDFIEGIRAKNNDKGELYYEPEGGVFLDICNDAKGKVVSSIDQDINLSGKKFWKMSLGDAKTEQHVYDYCIENNAILLGWGHNLDYSGCNVYDQIVAKMSQNGLSEYLEKYPSSPGFVDRFKNKIKIGDLVVISEGNHRFRAIGEVTSEYERYTGDDLVAGYVQKRSVKWLKVFQPSLPIDRLFKKALSQQTVYNLSTDTIDIEKLAQILKPEQAHKNNEKLDYVLIIDEINRGNISRIFGELITLIEESKREGQPEALSVTLPYSGDKFSVPDNVYIIGTMNSSDRSLTGLDIALRRRFTFIEMQPKPEELKGIAVSSGEIHVSIQDLLKVMNQRIEILLDRDHCLGHAYFMPLKEEHKRTLSELKHIFKQKILPLLQEYFYDDWERIDWVLNCNGMLKQQFQESEIEQLFPKSAHGKLQNQSWKINPKAFDNIENYQAIIKNNQKIIGETQ